MNWLDHGRTLREQGVEETEMLLLRRKFFYSDQNVDSRDPVQLNLLYVQVHNLPCFVSDMFKFPCFLFCPGNTTPPLFFKRKTATVPKQ